ncbi:MAG: glycosyltransferase family 2 protein [Rhodospirillales bacterium]|nr:glycosyltransferase family 2 protein [Alphaproteobacteria bacterium]USO03813.1 MAG: glycosyltransferase family 2 protein [Rhodospirillales bacterium]
MNKIPVSVLVTTLNEAKNLPRCLAALEDFDEVIVIDSGSRDGTVEAARSFGVGVIDYRWNGAYPKKRQDCLNRLNLKHDFIFFVDADEVVTKELAGEIRQLDFSMAGYFVKGRYVWKGEPLRFGLKNNKLALFDRRKIEFPVVDDLDISGMGEMEGHYQPVLKEAHRGEKTGQLRKSLLHYAYEDREGWEARHKRYAYWEAQMIRRSAYPEDPSVFRQGIKTLFRKMPLRAVTAFAHSYFLKIGFLDGAAGFEFARSRFMYYRLVAAAFSKTGKGAGIFGAETDLASVPQK